MEATHYKQINGFPDYYIDCHGNIISRRVHKNNPTGEAVSITPWIDKSGYLSASIRDCNGKRKNILIHREVAKAFVPNPYGYQYVNHKDRNTQNCEYTNLEWCTMAYNCAYTFTVGDKMHGCKCELLKNSSVIREFVSISEAAQFAVKKWGCNYNHLCNYLTEGEIVIRRLAPAISTYYVYQNDNIIYSSRYAIECYKYVNSKYNVSLSHKKRYSSKYRILIVKDNETKPADFWAAKDIAPTIKPKYTWDLYLGERLIGTYRGKRAASEHASKLFGIQAASLSKNGTLWVSGLLLRLVKKDRICS